MKTAIIYYSKHHGNTKKLLDAIAEKNDVTLIDVVQHPQADLKNDDRIGLASGIYYSKFHRSLLKYAAKQLPKGKPVFFLYTYGAEKKGYTDAVTEAVRARNAKVLGEYGCFGFNTYGPFKLIGGLAKGHPTKEELEGAVRFYQSLPAVP